MLSVRSLGNSYIHKLYSWHFLSFCGLDEPPSQAGVEPAFTKNALKGLTSSFVFSTNFPLWLVDLKSLKFVILFGKKAWNHPRDFYLILYF